MDTVIYKLYIRKLLFIGATSPISSLEVERSTSRIRRLKVAFRNTVKDERESNLNLLQIHTADSINVEILQMFIKKYQEDYFHQL